MNSLILLCCWAAACVDGTCPPSAPEVAPAPVEAVIVVDGQPTLQVMEVYRSGPIRSVLAAPVIVTGKCVKAVGKIAMLPLKGVARIQERSLQRRACRGNQLAAQRICAKHGRQQQRQQAKCCRR